jgi:hypothetical protein
MSKLQTEIKPCVEQYGSNDTAPLLMTLDGREPSVQILGGEEVGPIKPLTLQGETKG